MTFNDDHDVPWYQLKSSIVMITVTILAVIGVVLDPSAQEMTRASGFRIVESGAITAATKGL